MSDVLKRARKPGAGARPSVRKKFSKPRSSNFPRNGYAMTTLDQIAERAGVTKGTIYVYFENKEHLFISMVRELMKATLDTVQDMFETSRRLDGRSSARAVQLHLPAHRRGPAAA